MPDQNFEQRQAAIEQQAAGARLAYPALWQALVSDWRVDGPDAAWLTYSACYLLRTAGVRWALDPYSLFTRFKQPHPSRLAQDLAGLQAVVLSHAHADHLDLALLRSLRGLPLTWVVPEFMLGKLGFDLPRERLVLPRSGERIAIGALMLTPFEGRHFHAGGGVPEMGYLAEFDGRRWLFPGDTRDYSPGGLPSIERLDGVFAHLWLGKAAALSVPPPLLDAFCAFFAALGPARLVVTHLDELGRDADDLWDGRHYALVKARLAALAPGMRVECARTGERVELARA